jgi:hypothetical protein
MSLHSDGPVIKTIPKNIGQQSGNFNARGSAKTAGKAVTELLYSQVCCIQFVSFLSGACILIFFYCLHLYHVCFSLEV